MAPGIYSKISTDGGIGGGGPRTPSLIKKLHHAYQVIGVDNTGEVEVWKDRYGEHGLPTTTQLIDIVANMITKHKFGNSMEMFQETMKMKIVEELTKIVNDHNIIPEGEIEHANTIQRESRGNGSGHNSLLQRFISLYR